jgi:hypothetical protein
MKNHANIAAAHSTPTMFEVATLRSRKRPSGTSGVLDPRLDRQEDHEQHQSAAEHAERPAGRPPRLVAVHDRVDGEHQRGRHGDRAGDVDAPARGGDPVRRQQP